MNDQRIGINDICDSLQRRVLYTEYQNVLKSTTFGNTNSKIKVHDSMMINPAIVKNFRITSIVGYERASSGFVAGVQLRYTSDNNKNVIDGPIFKVATEEALTRREFKLEDHECITSVSGKSGYWLDNIVFHTSTNKSFKIGSSDGGNEFKTSKDVSVVRAIECYVGDQLDNLRVYYY